ncbi:MAG: MoaD/ThiS family protein [Planctomycetota bacterium]
MIRVKVLLFASLAERAGVREIGLRLPLESVAGDVWDAVVERYPELADARPTTTISVNLEYAEPGRVLADGDELALIPPVSGG